MVKPRKKARALTIGSADAMPATIVYYEKEGDIWDMGRKYGHIGYAPREGDVFDTRKVGEEVYFVVTHSDGSSDYFTKNEDTTLKWVKKVKP